MIIRYGVVLAAVVVMPQTTTPTDAVGMSAFALVLGGMMGAIEFVKWIAMTRREKNGNGNGGNKAHLQHMTSCVERMESAVNTLTRMLEVLKTDEHAWRREIRKVAENINDVIEQIKKMVA